jgi:hypothetical protein
MKTTPRVIASLLALLTACLAHAADSRTVARVISVQDVETDDPTGYATWISRVNEVAKAKLGIDGYDRVFVTTFDGRKTNRVHAVTAADSVLALTKNAAALEGDPTLAEVRIHLRAIRKLGAHVLCQGLRFDGAYKDASLFVTLASVSDEDGYLKALDQLRALYDGHGFQDAKINAYRVLAGRTDYSHLVTVGLPSAERLAAYLDFVSIDPQVADWIRGAAKCRTVVTNFTSREITK